jgi:hypothetical protein
VAVAERRHVLRQTEENHKKFVMTADILARPLPKEPTVLVLNQTVWYRVANALYVRALTNHPACYTVTNALCIRALLNKPTWYRVATALCITALPNKPVWYRVANALCIRALLNHPACYTVANALWVRAYSVTAEPTSLEQSC